MRYSIDGKTLVAKKARILINALVDCAKAGIKPSFVTNQMLRGISLYLECGSFSRENWQTYHRVSDAAKQVRASGDKDWKRNVTFEHARPLNVMYRMLLDERATRVQTWGRAGTAICRDSVFRFQSAFGPSNAALMLYRLLRFDSRCAPRSQAGARRAKLPGAYGRRMRREPGPFGRTRFPTINVPAMFQLRS
jgi:hypothetical protein